MLTEFLVTKKLDKLKWYKIKLSESEEQDLKAIQKRGSSVLPPWHEYEHLSDQIRTRVFNCLPDDESKRSDEEILLVDLILKKLDEIEVALFGKLSKESTRNESFLYKSSLDGNGMTCWRSNLVDNKSIAFSIHDSKTKSYRIPKDTQTTVPPVPQAYKPIKQVDIEPKSKQEAKKPEVKEKPASNLPKQIEKPDQESKPEKTQVSKELVPVINDQTKSVEQEIDKDKLKYSFKVKLNLKDSKLADKEWIDANPANKQVTFHIYDQNEQLNNKEPFVYQCETESDQFKKILLKIYFDLEKLLDNQDKKKKVVELKKQPKPLEEVNESASARSKTIVPVKVEMTKQSAYEVLKIGQEAFEAHKKETDNTKYDIIVEEIPDDVVEKQQPVETIKKFSEQAESLLEKAKQVAAKRKSAVLDEQVKPETKPRVYENVDQLGEDPKMKLPLVIKRAEIVQTEVEPANAIIVKPVVETAERFSDRASLILNDVRKKQTTPEPVKQVDSCEEDEKPVTVAGVLTEAVEAKKKEESTVKQVVQLPEVAPRLRVSAQEESKTNQPSVTQPPPAQQRDQVDVASMDSNQAFRTYLDQISSDSEDRYDQITLKDEQEPMFVTTRTRMPFTQKNYLDDNDDENDDTSEPSTDSYSLISDDDDDPDSDSSFSSFDAPGLAGLPNLNKKYKKKRKSHQPLDAGDVPDDEADMPQIVGFKPFSSQSPTEVEKESSPPAVRPQARKQSGAKSRGQSSTTTKSQDYETLSTCSSGLINSKCRKNSLLLDQMFLMSNRDSAGGKDEVFYSEQNSQESVGDALKSADDFINSLKEKRKELIKNEPLYVNGEQSKLQDPPTELKPVINIRKKLIIDEDMNKIEEISPRTSKVKTASSASGYATTNKPPEGYAFRNRISATPRSGGFIKRMFSKSQPTSPGDEESQTRLSSRDRIKRFFKSI